jgi:hypothetical protein
VAALGLVKELGAVIALAFMEWARIKRRQAEDKAAVATTDLKILQKQVEVEKADAAKDPRDVIGDFLAQPDSKK